MKVYLSGEISGLDIRVARERFAKAENLWKNLGVEVVNPLKNGLSIEDDWIKHISRDLELLNECKYVYMMEGWQRSVGACVEYDFSVRTGKKIYFESNMKRNGEKIARIEAAIHEVTGLRSSTARRVESAMGTLRGCCSRIFAALKKSNIPILQRLFIGTTIPHLSFRIYLTTRFDTTRPFALWLNAWKESCKL